MGADYETKLHIIPASGQIYDITHPDVNEHSVGLPVGYPANTRALLVMCTRMAGTGVIYLISTSGVISSRWTVSTGLAGVWVRAADGQFYHSLSVANDDWDLYAIGYIAG